MKFVLNSRQESAGARVWVHELARRLDAKGHPSVVNDAGHWDRYDVALVAAGEADIDAMRRGNPSLLIGLIDPKTPDARRARRADFLIVSSLEQRDLFLKYNPRCFVFYPFPETPEIHRTHAAKTPTVLGYHGNKIHLHSFHPHLTAALEALGRRYPIELHAIYNVKTLGRWQLGLPDPSVVPVRHVQWSEQAVVESLPQIDIGLVPALLPLRNDAAARRSTEISSRVFLTDPNDYVVRFKYSTNPGRLWVFAQAGIPIVAGLYPSAAQFIFDGDSGYLAHSAEGWYVAIESLIRNPDLRTSMAANLKATFDKRAGRDVLLEGFLGFVKGLSRQPEQPIVIPAVASRLRRQLLKERFAGLSRRLRRKAE